MMLPRRTLLAMPAVLAARRAQAASWPQERPVELVVPYPPSGGVDTMVRAIMAAVAPRIPGLRYAVVNRPGAGGQIGFEAIFNAAPDGYTLGAVTNTAMHAVAIERRPRYRPEDFTYIACVVDDPGGFFVRPDSPLRSLQDLRNAAQAAPESLAVGTSGIGSDDHLLMLGFEQITGTRLVHAPYNGTAPILRDLLGGSLPLGSFNMSEGQALLAEGRIRCLGQAGPQRWAPTGAVPTFREQGIDLLGGSARGIAGPPNLPTQVREVLAAGFRAAFADPAFIAEAARLNLPLRPLVGADYRAMMRADDAALRALWQLRPWKE